MITGISTKKGIQVSGVFGSAEVQRVLKEVTPRIANNLMKATVRGIATEMSKEAKRLAPTSSKSYEIKFRGKTKKMTGGNLRRTIKTKDVRRTPPTNPITNVWAGAFYWRFVEHGFTARDGRFVQGNGFLRRTVAKYEGKLEQMGAEMFSKRLEQSIKRIQKRNAGR